MKKKKLRQRHTNKISFKISFFSDVAKISITVICLSVAISVMVLGLKNSLFLNPTTVLAAKAPKKSVLQASTRQVKIGNLSINIPSFFNSATTFKEAVTLEKDITINGDFTFKGKKLDLGTGSLSAPNVVYGITSGDGVSVTTGQNPTIKNTGVLSLGGSVGALKLTAGTGITIDGLKITNSLTTPSTFKTVAITGGSSFDRSSPHPHPLPKGEGARF